MIRRTIFWIGSFGSIAVLLGHCYALASMARLTLILWLPLSIAMLGAWLVSVRRRDDDFLLRVRAGLLGGLWGNLGYDLVRIPFHVMGQNPFAPIRAYGAWLADAAHSTPWTDSLGFAYHLSNAITFGWIFSFMALRRHWGWAVLWALALETLSVLTPFGEIFGIRSNYGMLSVAYGAHLFFGYPLGKASQKPEASLESVWPPHRRGWGLATGFSLLFIGVWFLTAWQPVGRQPSLGPGEAVVGPDALYPGWTELDRGGELHLTNRLSEPVAVRLRRPGDLFGPGEEIVMHPGEVCHVAMPDRGVHQILIPDRRWRSILIGVREAGNYAPTRRPSVRN